MKIGWTSLEATLGHSYVDLQSFFQGRQERDWGEKLLGSLWEESKNEVRQLAFVDLLFESFDGDALYGFFAVSKRLRPTACGLSSATAYQLMLNDLFRSNSTVGSHSIFRRGLPSCKDVGLIPTEKELGDRLKQIDAENYLYGRVQVSVDSIDNLHCANWTDLFEFKQIPYRGIDLAIAHPDSLRVLREEGSSRNIIEAWTELLRAIQDSFKTAKDKLVDLDIYGIPVTTGSPEESASGALFMGFFM